jgi:hypothetical protein
MTAGLAASFSTPLPTPFHLLPLSPSPSLALSHFRPPSLPFALARLFAREQAARELLLQSAETVCVRVRVRVRVRVCVWCVWTGTARYTTRQRRGMRIS